MTGLPAFPRIDVVVRADATGEVTIQGVSYPVPTSRDVAAARQRAIGLVTLRAATTLGRPVLVTAQDPEGTWALVVHPSGLVQAAEEPLAPPLPHTLAAPIRLRTRDGQVSEPGRSLLVGRNPQPKPGETVEVLFAVRDPQRQISKTHARIDVADDGTITVTDRGSTNGTDINFHASSRLAEPGRAVVVPIGAILGIGAAHLILESVCG